MDFAKETKNPFLDSESGLGDIDTDTDTDTDADADADADAGIDIDIDMYRCRCRCRYRCRQFVLRLWVNRFLKKRKPANCKEDLYMKTWQKTGAAIQCGNGLLYQAHVVHL